MSNAQHAQGGSALALTACPPFEPQRSWPEFFRATLETWNVHGGTFTVGPRRLTDAQRFADAYPEVAAYLKVKPEPVPRPIFKLGEARHRRNCPRCDFRECVDLHASGNFGTFGVSSAEPPTGEPSVLSMNLRAIKTGQGVVCSRFPASGPGTPVRAYVCLVSTLLTPEGATTLVDVEETH